MFLAKDVSPWLRNNDKTKSKTFCEIARYFAECFGLEESVAIVMGGLKSTPIVSYASRILFPNCFSLRLIDISYMNGSRFLVIPFRMLGMEFHRNDRCLWGRGEKRRKAKLFRSEEHTSELQS